MSILKNKKVTYVLVSAVALLWVTIIVQVFFFGQNNGAVKLAVLKQEVPNKSAIVFNMPQKLLIKNKDPFGIKSSFKKNSKENKPQIHSKLQTPKYIEYLGFTNSKSKMLANIKFNNEFMVKQESDNIGDFRIIKVMEDSILLAKGSQRVYIRKN